VEEMMQQTAIDDYWTNTEEIGRLLLPPRDDEREVSFIWHQTREEYGRGHREIGLGVMAEPGERVYVHAKAVFYSPEIFVTFALTPPTPSELGTEIGQVIDSETRGQRRHEVASCKAWYYEKEKVLMIWEVDMRSNYRESADPTQDFVLSSVWLAFESALLREFLDVQTIITPGWEPSYEGEQFRACLQQLGYAPHEENSFKKIPSR
jgi:hypothetical protein